MSKAVATQKPRTVVQELERVKPFIAESLPAQMNPERFARLALTTLRKTPKLQQTSPESFVGALYTAAALGLEPGTNGEAYLVPYGRETQLIVGYQGLAKLFWNQLGGEPDLSPATPGQHTYSETPPHPNGPR